MKFSINVEKLINNLEPAFEIAMKNIKSGFIMGEKLTFNSMERRLVVTAHGGSAAILIDMSNDTIDNLDYKSENEGMVTVHAQDFMDALKSFPSNEVVNVTIDNTKLVISFVDSDSDVETQTLPIFPKDEEVKLPVVSSKFDKLIIANREIFVEGMNKVQFAIGYEITQPFYRCQLFEASKNKVRFAAGTGARFAVSDVKGKSIVEVEEKESIIFPRENISSFIKILDNASSSKVVIKQASADSAKNSPEQIILKFDNIIIIILGIDSAITYSDLDKVLNYDYPYRVSSNLTSWKNAIAGVNATNKSEAKFEESLHNTDVTAFFDKKHFIVQTEGTREAKRKVKFISSDEDTGMAHIRCNTPYFNEMITKGNKDGEITMEFDEGSMPVLIRYHQNINSIRDTVEDFSIFFAKAVEEQDD